MAHFRINEVNKDKKCFIKDFEYILDNIFCTYSYNKGYNRWIEIRDKINNDKLKSQMSIELGHVYIGMGIINARLAVKDVIEEFLYNN